MKLTIWDALFDQYQWYRKIKKGFWVYELHIWIRFSKDDSCFRLLSFESFKNQYKKQNKIWEDYT